MIKVGLTGGIASGKSQVSEIFRACGAYIIDTDVLSREVTAVGTAGAKALKKRFPSAFDGDVLNRRALRTLVFGDRTALDDLNGITHPLILQAVERRLEDCTAAVAVVVAPLLFEVGLEKTVDVVVTVTADPETRIRRLVLRDTISEDLARAMLKNQMDERERVRRADVVIDNNGDLDRLEKEVKKFYSTLVNRAK